MAKISLHQLGEKLRRERGERGVREVAKEIGVSAATLSRVERGKLPDLKTFGKICEWLEFDPAQVLGLKGQARNIVADEGVTATAHLRADQTTSPELARALAEMILAADRMLKKHSRGPAET